MFRIRERYCEVKAPIFHSDVSFARIRVSPSLLHTLILCVIMIVSRI